jgi:hypothetical protein
MDSLINISLDGKPLEKLIEVVSNGIGTIYRPRQIRKEADARAYEIKVIENAKSLATSEAKLIAAVTDERISQRLVDKETRRQENIDSVVEMAAKNLEGKTVSDKSVDEDWATRFFDIVQDVSKDEMKALWAKILSKEIETPFSYSLRTLEILRNISYEEANLFVKLSDYVLNQSDYFIFAEYETMEKFGVGYKDIAKLREIGLLQSGDFVTSSFHANPNSLSTVNFVYGNTILQFTFRPSTIDIEIPVILLTQAGQQIYQLIETKQNWDYIRDIFTYIKKSKPSSTLHYGEILEIIDNQIKYDVPLNEFFLVDDGQK